MVVKKMVRKQLSPHQNRISFINMLVSQGKTYQEAVREYDRQQKAKK